MNDKPKISLFNRQRKLSLSTRPLVEFFLELELRLGELDCSIVLVSDSAIRKLNRDYAFKDYPTDVLSFPTSDVDRRNDPYLGDVVISVETAARQATASLLEELKVLSLHGVLHLLGYDHETDDGEMKALEKELRADMNLD